MIINTAGLAALFTVYNAAFKQGWGSIEPSWNKIATLVPSSGESNLYAFLGQFPSLRKWVGDRLIKNMAAHSYTIINDPFESTVGVPKPKVEDDTYGVFTPLFAEMGYAARVHPDELVFALLALGATELCYDGQPFFDSSHPVIENGSATTKDNYDATGGGNLWCLMDVRRPLKPLIFQKRQDYKFQTFNSMKDEHVFKRNEFMYGVDARVNVGFGFWQTSYGSLNTLNATNYETYLAKMIALKTDEDKPMGIVPGLCVVGPSNLQAARELFLVDKLASGATNSHYKECEILMTPYLT